MASVVGSKGQVVIEKEIRDRLGVEHGWLAVQILVDGHVEIHFVPPRHRRSLKGLLARHVKVRVPPGPAWDRGREHASKRSAAEKMEARERP